MQDEMDLKNNKKTIISEAGQVSGSPPFRKIPVKEAIGLPLAHDITRIEPDKTKIRAFQRGHIIREDDIPLLLDLGKEYIYALENGEGFIHEDTAALRLAVLASGPGMIMEGPDQGRITFKATRRGLLRVNVKALYEINSQEKIILSTLHDKRQVESGQIIAGTRIVPLMIEEEAITALEKKFEITTTPVLEVKEYRPRDVGLVITGSEIYHGRIKDGAENKIKGKMADYASEVFEIIVVPDDAGRIHEAIIILLERGAELILVTGGMSVDPDDVTPVGIISSGARVVTHGAPVLPGSQLLVAYHGDIPVLGLPACILYNAKTSLDLLLPRIFAGEQITREDIAAMGHGGLCDGCGECRFPGCPFGK